MATLIERRKILQGVTMQSKWLTKEAVIEIKTTLGSSLGNQVVKATDAYLDSLSNADAQALATYINLDPLMVCSLPLTGVITPKRGLLNDGTVKFLLNYPYTNDMTLEFDLSLANTNNELTLLTDGNWGGSRPLLIVFNNTFRWHISAGGSIDSSVTISADTYYDLLVGNGLISVNGTADTESSISYSFTSHMRLFGLNLTTDTTRSFQGTLFQLQVRSSMQNHTYIPYSNSGTIGLLDIYNPQAANFSVPECGTPYITLT